MIDPEVDERLLAIAHYRTITRLAMDIGLLLGLVGAALPFGMHDLSDYSPNAYEWGLSALALVAALGIVFDLAIKPSLAWPFALAAFSWASIATYAALAPIIVGARVAFALIFGGYAIAAALAWRINASYRTGMRR